MTLRQRTALQTLPLVDLTRLEADDSASAIEELCSRAGTDHGAVAAVCVYPRYIPSARDALAERGLLGEVAIATVVNFPSGGQQPADVVAAIGAAIDAGCDEVDLVFPWGALRHGDAEAGRNMVAVARAACGNRALKVILETGELSDPTLIRQAAEIAIEAGADFLKTSTGKVPVNATPEATRILLETIRDSGKDVGCKVSGGIRTTEQARVYLDLAAEIMGANWIGPHHFRFGASGLLDDLLAALNVDDAGGTDEDGY
ncbi:MAG: deoxyribose-phosphate aldolase [Gammaproteobacteria bacterium]|nr:deoxyribose-phosphate aldolase [Gammaproteobacteria bacterium]